LVLTDPPHSDRIPYLELSEVWNAILGKEADYSGEIVVSNAKERMKTKEQYSDQIQTLLKEIDRILVPDGTLALLFNARDAQSWNGLIRENPAISLQYYGCFPMNYSANSVVQDNREGSMKSDYVLIYKKPRIGGDNVSIDKEIHTIPGWSEEFPRSKG
jgi:adenine-specific DNA methylase